ncbi:MAG: hypothetical protein OXQ90_04035 [Gammaproteobacteria bacterium]|nr:hypothetical protein [Gammaproteobacteria bacterium]
MSIAGDTAGRNVRKGGERVAWTACVAAVVLLGTASANGAAEAGAQTVADQVGLLRLLGAGLLGALLVKVLEIGYQEVRRGSERRGTARQFVDEHLDPVLKAADELVGKLRSLAMADFKTLRARQGSHERNHDLVDVLYLVSRLWANLELFRGGGQTVSVVRDTRGKRLAAFADCLESRRVRIVRRSSQRAVAELALVAGNEGAEVIRFVDFVRRFEEDVEAQRWLAPLERALGRMEHTADRQRLLRYGIVVHALIDTLDPEHEVSKDRRSYAHKLSYKSWNELERRVFRVYLKFVEGTQKYLGPPRRRPQGGGGGTEGL